MLGKPSRGLEFRFLPGWEPGIPLTLQFSFLRTRVWFLVEWRRHDWGSSWLGPESPQRVLRLRDENICLVTQKGSKMEASCSFPFHAQRIFSPPSAHQNLWPFHRSQDHIHNPASATQQIQSVPQKTMSVWRSMVGATSLAP